MSEEIKEVNENQNGTSMYVHLVDYDTICKVLNSVTDVNKMFVYNMPNKAEKYGDDAFELINLINDYIGGDEDWRITRHKNVKINISDNIIRVGDWEIKGIVKCLCIPKINSIIIIPDDSSVCNGAKEPTKIIHLSNCISVTPLLIKLTDEPIEGEENRFNLGLRYEVITPPSNEKPTE